MNPHTSLHSEPSAEQTLRAENADLRARLEDAEQMLRAIRAGEVDALVVEGDAGPQIYTLQGVDSEQNRFRGEILSQISDIVIGTDDDRRITYLNAAAEQQYRVRVGDVLGCNVSELYTPLWPGPESEDDMRTALREKGEWRGELIHRTHDGRDCPVEATITTLHASDRTTIGYVDVIRDITSRRQAEKALRESEERFRIAADVAKALIYEVDLCNDNTTVTEGLERVVGFAPEDISLDSRWWHSRIHPDDLSGHLDNLKRIMDAGERYCFEYRVQHANGAWIDVEDRGQVIRNSSGAPSRLEGAITDITERKRAEAELRTSSTRLQGILQQSPAGIVQTDADGRMVLVNERWCQMLGYTEAELLGKSVFEVTHESSVAATAEAVGRLAAGGPDFQIEKSYNRKDGSILSAQSNVTALRSPDGQFEGLIAVVLDITERLRIEEEVRQVAAALRDADRRKDEFLATLAHELRNPLAPIRNGLHILKLAGMDGTVEQARTMMDRQLTQMVRLVDDLLDVSRITRGKIELRAERLDLRTVVAAAVETSQPVIDEAGHELVVSVPDEPLFVNGDPTRLAQVVSNLLNNSAKYMHRGGHIRLGLVQEGDSAVLTVNDTGIGIPPAMLSRVFEMFTQVDRALEKTTGGLGIGLSLVHGLVTMHGGSITAYSQGEGMGSDFVVRLPIWKDEGGRMKDESEADPHPSSFIPHPSKRILVVDDNRDSATTLAMLLKLSGNETRTAYDGLEAVEMAANFRPDVVLLDIGLPKLNGYEACRRIREQPWSNSVMMVALTGWGQEEDRQKSSEAGFDAHMVKPVDLNTLKQLLDGACQMADGLQ